MSDPLLLLMQMIPKHIAIIMDGNGRWAKAHKHARFFGHVRGANRISPIVKKADHLGIKALTLYAFSSENWKRPESERNVLWKLLIKFLKKELPNLQKNNVSLHIYGDTEKLPDFVRTPLQSAIETLSENTGLCLGFCVSYGGRDEIAHAVKQMAQKSQESLSQKSIEEISTEIQENLYTKNLGPLSDVDLVIRTSGEIRTSNFLIWQSAYAEYIFVQKPWPDFTPEDFESCVSTFQRRQRRFGEIAPSA